MYRRKKKKKKRHKKLKFQKKHKNILDSNTPLQQLIASQAKDFKYLNYRYSLRKKKKKEQKIQISPREHHLIGPARKKRTEIPRQTPKTG